MNLIIPVKAGKMAKQRLSSILNETERERLCHFMLEDVLQAIRDAGLIQSTTVVSSDDQIASLAGNYHSGFMPTPRDHGYAADAAWAVRAMAFNERQVVAVMPADIPQLCAEEIRTLERKHRSGITLCPALRDGGTNALVFTTPPELPMLFGVDSLQKYRQYAETAGIPVQLLDLPGFARDIDTPEDIDWLMSQKHGGRAREYLRSIASNINK